MSVQGSLATMPAADLFEWLDRRPLSGEVSFEREGMSRKFSVAAKHVTSASSTNPAEYLGQMLINAGHLDEAKLNELYQAQEASGMALGMLLTTRQVVSETTLAETLQTKIREGVYDALSWTNGTFTFVPLPAAKAAPASKTELDVRVAIRSLLADGTTRAAQWKAVRQVIPSDDVRFVVTDPIWLTKVKAGSPSAALLADVGKGLTVRQIVFERRSLAFPVVQRLAELVQRRVLSIDTERGEVKEAEPPPAPPPGTRPTTPVPTVEVAFLVEEARSRAKAGDARGALDAAKAAVSAAPESAEAQRIHEEAERRLFAELSRALLTRFRVPKVLVKSDELKRLSLSDEERYLVGRIDGRWDLLSLMRVSSLREVEALITLQRLAERGVISLE